ncbi:fibrinogen-related protein J6 precursor [Biomphalaria glabrata]|nr:fibrinogen-related protein J6 precursor [Biomphalaria glabrata]
MAFFLRLALWASLAFWSASELVIDVQPSVISPEITRQLVINCSITNNQVQHIEVIKFLTLSRYIETIREFEDLFVLNTSTLILTQQKDLTVTQISYGNTHITLTLHNPSQFDAKVYRCNATGDNTEGTNISLYAKKAVEYETNSTALIEEIRRYKKNENFQCSLKKDEHSEVNQRSRLHFYGSSEMITELIEPLTITCLYKTLNQGEKETSALQSLYILHETNGVIAYINKEQPAITTIQKSNLKNVEGEIFDNESKDSYLQVTWNNLKHSESGKYFCEAHINRSDGRFDKLNDIVTIIVRGSTLDDLVKVTHTLLRQAEVDQESLRDNTQKLKTIKEDLDINIHNIINLKKDLNDKQENIRINENLDTKQQDITCLKEDMNSTKQDIISLKEDMNSTKQDIISLKDNMNSTKQYIVSIKKDLDTTQANMKSLNEDFYTNIQNITSIKKDMNTYKENILRIETDLDSNKQNIVSIRKEADTNKQDIIRIKEDLDTKQQNMLSIRENVDTNRHNMSIFQENLTMMVANLSTELKEVQSQIHKESGNHSLYENELKRKISETPTHALREIFPKTSLEMFKKAYFVESTKFSGSTYLLSKDSLFFYPSFGQAMCGLVGGYLVEVNTIQELKFIQHFLFEKASRFVLVMAGGTDEDHEGLWINGHSLTKVDLLWDRGQPDDYQGVQDCQAFNKNYNWNLDDVGCVSFNSRHVGFLCEVRE